MMIYQLNYPDLKNNRGLSTWFTMQICSCGQNSHIPCMFQQDGHKNDCETKNQIRITAHEKEITQFCDPLGSASKS